MRTALHKLSQNLFGETQEGPKGRKEIGRAYARDRLGKRYEHRRCGTNTNLQNDKFIICISMECRAFSAQYLSAFNPGLTPGLFPFGPSGLIMQILIVILGFKKACPEPTARFSCIWVRPRAHVRMFQIFHPVYRKEFRS